VNIQFQGYCPDCKKTVAAFLLNGSLEKLQQNQADVEVGHSTTKGHIGAHKWILVNQRDRDSLRKRTDERRLGAGRD
jgi:hypothetical protein